MQTFGRYANVDDRKNLYGRRVFQARRDWIANLRDWTIEKHRLPNDLGYGEVRPYSGSDEIAIDVCPNATFTVDELLGPPAGGPPP